MLVITAITTIISSGYAASSTNSSNTNSKDKQISYFDPFELITLYLDIPEIDQVNISTNGQNESESESVALLKARPIRIPVAPRSISTRSLASAESSSSHYPGAPPWNATQ